MSAFRSITLSEATGLNEQLINELQSKLGCGREYTSGTTTCPRTAF